MFKCIWCGRHIPSPPELLPAVSFKHQYFHVCSTECRERTLRYVVIHERAVRILKWLVLPGTVIYVGVVSMLIFSEIISPNKIDLYQAILLIWIGLVLLFLPASARLKHPVGWRNIRIMIRLRIAIGFMFCLLGVMEYLY